MPFYLFLSARFRSISFCRSRLKSSFFLIVSSEAPAFFNALRRPLSPDDDVDPDCPDDDPPGKINPIRPTISSTTTATTKHPQPVVTQLFALESAVGDEGECGLCSPESATLITPISSPGGFGNGFRSNVMISGLLKSALFIRRLQKNHFLSEWA